MSSERNDLNRQLRDKKAEVTSLETKISDLNELISQRDSILNEVSTLNESKAELETFIDTNNVQKQTLTTEIATLTAQKTELETYVQTNTPIKDTIQTELGTLNTQKDSLNSEIESLSKQQETIQSGIDKINQEKERLDNEINILRSKHGLYSKDMKDIAEDSKTQLDEYSKSAKYSVIASLILMIILLCILTLSNPYSEKLLSYFYQEPNLRFYSILAIRLSISAAFIFLIIIFLNLARGFISQYIKTRNRLSAVRITDFLIGRLESKKIAFNTDEEKLKIEAERIKEQVELLNTHIPKIMDLGSSSFDKLSKTENPIELLTKMKDLDLLK
jgi:predicted  nucleic acid-binding Zn-ribbon protein